MKNDKYIGWLMVAIVILLIAVKVFAPPERPVDIYKVYSKSSVSTNARIEAENIRREDNHEPELSNAEIESISAQEVYKEIHK